MDLQRRRLEWHVLKGLCRGLVEPAWAELWSEAESLRPQDFSHTDLGKVFRVLKTFRQEWRGRDVPADDLADALRVELEWTGLSGFSVECLVGRSPSDPDAGTLREGVRMLLGATSPMR